MEMKINKAKKTGLIHSANQNRQDFSVVLMPYNANRKKNCRVEIGNASIHISNQAL